MGKILIGYVRGPQGEIGPEGEVVTAEGTPSVSNTYSIIEADDIDAASLTVHNEAFDNRAYIQGVKTADYMYTLIGTKFDNGDGWQLRVQISNTISNESPDFVWRYLVENKPSKWFDFNAASILSVDTTALASDVRAGKTYLGADTNNAVGTGSAPVIKGWVVGPYRDKLRKIIDSGSFVDGDVTLGKVVVSDLSAENIRAGVHGLVDSVGRNNERLTNLLDVTGTLGANFTADAARVLKGYTFMGVNGEELTGNMAEYAGSTSVTPTKQAQTLGTANKWNNKDISVAAIPANYVDRGSAAKTAVAGDVRIGKTFVGANDAQLTGTLKTQAAKTVGATAADQTIIAAGTIADGAQIVKAVTKTNLDAAYIKNKTTVTIASNGTNIWSVAGTYGSTTTLSDTNDLVKGKIAIGSAGATVYTGALATQAGGTYKSGTANSTIVTSPKKITSNIIVQGDANLKAENIKKGVTILGVAGSYEGGTLVGKGSTLYLIKDGKFQTGWIGSWNYGDGEAKETTYNGKNAVYFAAYHRYVSSGVDNSSYPASVRPANGKDSKIILSTGSNSTFKEAGITPMICTYWCWTTYTNMNYESPYMTTTAYGITPAGVETSSTITNKTYMSISSTRGDYSLDSSVMLSAANQALYNKMLVTNFNIQPSADSKTCNLVFYVNEMYIKLA